MAKIIFPTLTRFPFHTEKGNFYQHINDGIWKRIECYLPASPATYNCDSMEQVADKVFDKLISGQVKIKRGLTDSGKVTTESYNLIAGVMVNIRNPSQRLEKILADALQSS
ncbi:hypothetical protein [Escherichia coli]|uniref:hypothetical protein n=1 Tax=Escherichia coli TaxID=562 RepID=UPI001CBB6814|nr:hypothetical protein [Escherichia coli]EHK0711327.1 hypothetical protein [Escherichia coli]EHK3804552.1 hypothetical protein [Escherichia coli]EHS6988223.1 hypothetical protein [Escherichia coli]EIK6955717.1 hypothetical protein [Escherichia coli]EIW6481785.1 hypothetical protein [Escherichia coli]